MNLLNFEEQFINNSEQNNLENNSDNESDNDSENQSEEEKEFKLDTIDELEYKINIRIINRNSKKSIIQIENLPKFFLENKELIKNVLDNLKKDLATRATLKVSKENFKFIELSGTRVDLVINRLKIDLKCKNNNIILHNFN